MSIEANVVDQILADVFLAYSRANQRRARRFVEMLEALDYSVFWDINIPSGQTWDSFVGSQINAAGAVLVLWSKTAVQSDNVIEEATAARQQDKLFPVRITSCDLPHGFLRLNTIDLIHWRYQPTNANWQRLLRDLHQKIGR